MGKLGQTLGALKWGVGGLEPPYELCYNFEVLNGGWDISFEVESVHSSSL